MATTAAPAPATPAASSKSNTVSYETFAPRSTAQVARLSRIAALTAGPITMATTFTATTAPRSDSTKKAAAAAGMVPPPILDDPLYHKCGDATDIVTSVLQKSLLVHDRLTTHYKHTSKLKLALRASMNIAEDLSNRHADLIRHSSELSAAADRLQDEESMLTAHAAALGQPLQHYDAVDRIGIQVGVLFKNNATVHGLARIKVDDDDFETMLDEIDASVEYFGRESGGAEALQHHKDKTTLSGNLEYYRRALALQEAAAHLMQEAVAARITHISQQIAAALASKHGVVSADQLEASLLYTRYHGISQRSNRLVNGIRRHMMGGFDAYADVYKTCRNTYASQRESLLRPTVRAHLEMLKEQHGPVGMTRLASVFLIRLCTIETALYLDFFGELKKEESSAAAAAAAAADGKKVPRTTRTLAAQLADHDKTHHQDSDFQAALTSLCGNLHRTVRRSLVTMHDLDTLCQIVTVLREEHHMASTSPTTAPAASAIGAVIQDAQERLIFCANATLTKQVIRFKATPSDLNYPDKLIVKKEASTAAVPEGTTSADAAAKTNELDALEKVYEMWFPPVKSILRILSKIFRVVDDHVFEAMALESVQACTKCLRDGASYIRARKGVMDADLFLVKHLLILREQLSPFDIELRSIQKQLDFSDAGKAVARFLANRNRRLFSMTTENALLSLLREGVSVQESPVDSKRDLEDGLRTACNDLIEHASKDLAGDLLALAARIKSGDGNEDAESSCDAVAAVCTQVLAALDDRTMSLTAQMRLYLDNASTLNILLKPIARQVVRAVEDVRKMRDKYVAAGGQVGWDDGDKVAALTTQLDEVEDKVKHGLKASR